MITVTLPPGRLPTWLRHHGRERVGLLIGSRDGHAYTVRRIVPVRNSAVRTLDRFRVTVQDAQRMVGDAQIVGVLHTHTAHDSEPSDHDIASIPDGFIGGVVLHHRIVSWYTSAGAVNVKLMRDVVDAIA
jgi:proteasome lid subunit RPN8/RPN11